MKELTGILKNTRAHLMNGVSYMLPVVVGGGILMAVAVMLAGEGAVPETGFTAKLWQIGVSALGLMVPVLSAYIAVSIADRPGIAPGLAGGVLANAVGAGFLGGIISGLFAGILCHYLKKIPLPKAILSLKSIIIIPVVSVLLTGLMMLYVIGTPIAGLMDGMTAFLTNMSEGNKVFLGLIIGAMIAFDLGGPVNKVAFGFMVATIGMGIYSYAGPCAIAIAVPPLGAGTASLILKKKFTKEEREAGIGALAMGAVGISEGAISYTSADPLHMIPINMISSAIASAIAYAINVSSRAAWGGLIVLPVVENRIGYVISMGIGVGVYVVLCAVFKKNAAEVTKTAADDDDVDISFE
ncbi:MAG: fructose-specific PTS transporter subunit EIIC [Lacrimispora sp.]|uniref:PTS fructose transporter subunit IIC n=1 Tax=Lacrimispora sp. TaxID=2719234 RepID=UPI0039E5CA78